MRSREERESSWSWSSDGLISWLFFESKNKEELEEREWEAKDTNARWCESPEKENRKKKKRKEEDEMEEWRESIGGGNYCQERMGVISPGQR